MFNFPACARQPAPVRPACCVCGAPADCVGDTSGYKCFECAREEFDLLDDEEAVKALGFEVLHGYC